MRKQKTLKNTITERKNLFYILILVITVAFAVSCTKKGNKVFGTPFKIGAITSIEDFTKNKKSFAGKVIQVRGKVTEVCTTMKCWFYITDGKNNKLYIDLQMNTHFTADISRDNRVLIQGKIKPIQQGSSELVLFADGIVVEN